MTLDPDRLAAELVDAAAAVAPIELISSRYAELDWDSARRIARATDARYRAAGRTQIGWKLGWTSSAMRDALGIDRPNWGTLWDVQVASTALERSGFIHPKAEPELVWTAPADLSGPDVTADQIRPLGGAWHLGIEVVDPRFPSFDFDALDNTADNSSSAAVAVAPSVPLAPSAVDAVTVAFSDGSEVRTGASSLAMGSPWEAVAWLVRALAAEGLAIRRGDIVFTGGLTAPFDVVAGARFTLEAPGMESVELMVS